MRIMTSNIWGDYFGNEVSSRENGIFSVFEKYDADVIGLQEVTESWYKSRLFKNLSENYNFVGTEIFNSRNHTPLAIKKEYSIIANGYERLCDTPDKSKSITWAVVENKDYRFAVCNTHFWWMNGQQSEADKKILFPVVGDLAYADAETHNKLRTKNAEQMSSLMKRLSEKYSCAVFAFGDMNTTISAEVFKIYKENNIHHLWDDAPEKDYMCSIHGNPERGEDGLFHGKKTTDDYILSIDHIVGLGKNFSVSRYRLAEDQEALDATDHSPVYADIVLK